MSAGRRGSQGSSGASSVSCPTLRIGVVDVGPFNRLQDHDDERAVGSVALGSRRLRSQSLATYLSSAIAEDN
jgi:hypothetical protein